MEYGKTIVDLGGDVRAAWWVVAVFTILIVGIVIVAFWGLPQKHKWLVIFIPVVTFFTTPWLIGKIIDHIIAPGQLAADDIVLHSYFFDWPRYYPSLIAFGLAVFLAKYKRNAVA